VRRVLAVKVHDQLGDFLLATPALRALRRRFPGARLALVTRAFLAPLARRQPDADAVWALPRLRRPADLLDLARTVGRVAAFRPDLVVVLNSVSRSGTADSLAALARGRLVVGRGLVGPGPIPADAGADPFEGAARGPRDPVYDLDLPFGARSDHQSERYLDLVRWCGAAAPPEPVLALSPDERRAGERGIGEALGERAARPWVGLHPGAANPLKCWPLESFVELGVALAARGTPGAPATDQGTGPSGGGEREGAPALVVFDSPRERGRAAAVWAGLAARGVRAAFLPPAGIEEFAARCAALDLLVCNDSGVLHVAGALGVPTVSFHALGRLAEWAPRSDRAVALHAGHDIAALPVPAALEAALRLLEAFRVGRRPRPSLPTPWPPRSASAPPGEGAGGRRRR
jgi:ADP-heptose:LPS heptosyltransferase